MYKYLLKILCTIVGHKWNYKDYSLWMKDNGDKYYFDASRNCSLCNESQYYINDWKKSDKSKYDIEKDSESTKHFFYYN